MGVDQGCSRVRMPGLPGPKLIAHHNVPPSPILTLASKSASRFKRANVTVPRSRRSMATRVGCSKARRSIPPNMVTWPTRTDGSTGPSSCGGGDSRVCASIIRSRDTAARGSLSPASSSVFQCRAWSRAVSPSKRSALKTRLPAMARSEPTAAAASNRKISMSNLLPTCGVADVDSPLVVTRSWASRSASSRCLLLSLPMLPMLSSARDAPQPQSGPSPSPLSRPRP